MTDGMLLARVGVIGVSRLMGEDGTPMSPMFFKEQLAVPDFEDVAEVSVAHIVIAFMAGLGFCNSFRITGESVSFRESDFGNYARMFEEARFDTEELILRSDKEFTTAR